MSELSGKRGDCRHRAACAALQRSRALGCSGAFRRHLALHAAAPAGKRGTQPSSHACNHAGSTTHELVEENTHEGMQNASRKNSAQLCLGLKLTPNSDRVVRGVHLLPRAVTHLNACAEWRNDEVSAHSGVAVRRKWEVRRGVAGQVFVVRF
jgi:hypothetical protein